jgi:hypothetical protein
MAEAWQKEAKCLLRNLEKKEELLLLESSTLKRLVEDVENNIREIKSLSAKYEVSLEALRNENKVMAEVTIPALTSACQLGLERWNAETAIQVRRQILPESKSKE